ncbi:MAG: TonB-dependent receptor [Alistipes sp.]|nr:TonB-dependent receptor [Alistipes sp.]
MKRIFTKVAAALLVALFCQSVMAAEMVVAEPTDTLGYYKNEEIEMVSVSAIMPKQHFGLKRQPIASSVIGEQLLEREHIGSVKELSAIIPNFYQPDYGSKMTSSIYVRGFGARIDQPVIGMMVDGVPYLNKNNYDFDMLDVVRVEMLRGPQGTLYGRNTMGGQMNVYTLSPMHYKGLRGSVEYGSGNTLRAKASYYGRSDSDKFGYSVGAYYNRTDGFFDNSFDGSNVDWGQASGGRVRTVWRIGSGWMLDNVASVGYTDEGGYAYALYDEQSGQVGAVNYNSPSGYMRLNVNDGLVLSYAGERVKFSATTSYQFMHDRMRMDNDLTPMSYFTLEQEQHEHALSEDVVFKSADGSRRWQWITGAYGFYKNINMSAPVNILEDGINSLILGNMPDMIKALLQFDRDALTIASNFDLPTYGLAVYHESSLRAGERWRFTAGLRLDYEAAKMEYDNHTQIGYKMGSMRPGMPELVPDFRQVELPFKGEEKMDYFELLPKFAVNFTTGVGDLYVTATRGYKAGGFNTQIFSDILQNKFKSALMSDAMTAVGRPSSSSEPSPYDEASVTTYKPEYSWNYEVGGHLMLAQNKLGIDFAAFWIECRDQQLTVFPDGLTTGRMMSNAGKSRSQGVELSASWNVFKLLNLSHLNLMASYGYTNAKFVEFNDGIVDYKGNHLPYAPQHTASLGAAYNWWIGGRVLDEVVLNASWQGVGDIYWNEANTLKQDFYSQLNASVELRKGDFSLSLWGRNLTNTEFYTFYFKSMTNNFYNYGKPCRLGVTLSFSL